MRSETKHQHDQEKTLARGRRLGRAGHAHFATLLDAEPADCELLRAILYVGVGHRKRDPEPLNERRPKAAADRAREKPGRVGRVPIH